MWKPNQAGPNSPSTPEPARPAPPASTPTAYDPAVRPAAGNSSVAIPSSEQATIGKSLFVKGEVTGSESLYIDGKCRRHHQPAGQPRHRRPQWPGRGQHHRPRSRRARQGARRHERQRPRRHPQRRLPHRKRRRRPHLHRGWRLLQGWHRHPQAQRRQRWQRVGLRARHRRSQGLAHVFESR